MGISSKIRLKRFKVKEDSDLQLVIQSQNGKSHKFHIDGLSLHGLSVTNDSKTSLKMQDGELASCSKIVGNELEIPLGRIVMRHNSSNHLMGFSCVDAKIPIDGVLSKFIDAIEINPHEVELNPNKFTLKEFLAEQSVEKDILGKCRQFGIMLREWEKQPQFQYRTVRERSRGTRINISSQNRPVVVMGSNDYLGLADHPKVMEAAKKAIDVYGVGSTGSPLTTGLTTLHEELCDFLASFLKKEKVILFNSGYNANLGAIQGLSKDNDLLVADFLSHASIQDGMKLASSSVRYFKHNSLEHLESILRTKRHQFAGCTIITEGIFSMDGDLPRLKEIIDIAKRYDARVYLDEAHSLGVIGKAGEGTASHLKLSKQVDVLMGTFSKCFGSIGGFVAADRDVCDWLYMFARSHMFSVALPPTVVAAVLAAGQIIKEEPERIMQLKSNIRYFIRGLQDLGAPVSEHHESSVIPLIIGSEEKMGIMNQYLIENGVFVVPIVFPAVQRNACRFRFTVMATHSQSQLDFVLHVLKNAMEKAGHRF